MAQIVRLDHLHLGSDVHDGEAVLILYKDGTAATLYREDLIGDGPEDNTITYATACGDEFCPNWILYYPTTEVAMQKFSDMVNLFLPAQKSPGYKYLSQK